MAVKILAEFKRLAIIGVALLGFVVIVNWAARAGTTNPVLPDRKQQNQYAMVVAQNETQTSPKEKTAAGLYRKLQRWLPGHSTTGKI